MIKNFYNCFQMNKCILHIGIEKTGSTALQHFFNANRKNLRNYHFSRSLGECNNYLLPLAFCDNYVLNRDVFDLELVEIVEKHSVKKREIINSFKVERRNFPNQDWIISSEHLSSRLLKRSTLLQLKELLNQLDFSKIIVVIYFRNIYEYIYSSYYTYLESGGNAEFIEFICSAYNIRNSNYYSTYKMWSDVFEIVDINLYKKEINIISHFVEKYQIDFTNTPDVNFSKNITRINEIENLNKILIEKNSNFHSIDYINYKDFMSPNIKDLIYSLFYPSLQSLGRDCFNDANIFIS
jgi:hypothetical protein